MMIDQLKAAIASACKDLYGEHAEPIVERTSEQFGDYATNVAMQLAPKLGKSPKEIASSVVEHLHGKGGVRSSVVAGPGFINITLTDQALLSAAGAAPAKPLAGRTIVAEYSDPNPFKILHAGHLYTSVVGDSIANLLENAGATVHRVNFGGDVGLHVAKTMWAMLQDLGGENPLALGRYKTLADQIAWLSDCYVRGTNAYEDNEAARAQIVGLNTQVYQLHETSDQKSPLAQIYWTARGWSYDYFKSFYEFIGSHFEKFYPESAVAELGLRTVQEQLARGVFKKSDGAVVFDGEAYGLHTRVFINSQGLPTYEAKDVGLILQKWQDYHFDKSIVITGNEQAQYMSVVIKAVEQFQPKMAQATTHLTHGMVKLAGGAKMSSRMGNILRATDVLNAAAAANQAQSGKDDKRVALGAVKYSFLKQRLGGDIVYNPEESVSIEGNSGPYLQYAFARASSILNKSQIPDPKNQTNPKLESAERSLVRKISEYPEVLALATAELTPHHICTYLYELAQTFNRFYESSRIIGDPREQLRLELVKLYSQTLKNGLELLGIEAPEHM